MRRLLKNRKSQEFFCQGQWTKDPSLAQSFPGIEKAIETCYQLQLNDMEVILQFGPEPSHYDITLPLS